MTNIDLSVLLETRQAESAILTAQNQMIAERQNPGSAVLQLQ